MTPNSPTLLQPDEVEQANAYEAHHEHEIAADDARQKGVDAFIDAIVDLRNAGMTNKAVMSLFTEAMSEVRKMEKEQAEEERNSGNMSEDIEESDDGI
ncbi:hypothetical protein GQ607_017900 [Colletotrichum asianum]|uniref:Uncharacterized protein n=1 Tax=Colletotrichum asianum TaxID=702518 RepID=A0A8H3VWQ5_9PEZI|nr:hypothetical protein GQ607_017900 [Colletotrichum asianum]